MEDAYANLIGEWVIIDNNRKSYHVTFSESVINKSYNMKGWGNYDEFSIVVLF